MLGETKCSDPGKWSSDDGNDKESQATSCKEASYAYWLNDNRMMYVSILIITISVWAKYVCMSYASDYAMLANLLQLAVCQMAVYTTLFIYVTM